MTMVEWVDANKELVISGVTAFGGLGVLVIKSTIKSGIAAASTKIAEKKAEAENLTRAKIEEIEAEKTRILEQSQIELKRMAIDKEITELQIKATMLQDEALVICNNRIQALEFEKSNL